MRYALIGNYKESEGSSNYIIGDFGDLHHAKGALSWQLKGQFDGTVYMLAVAGKERGQFKVIEINSLHARPPARVAVGDLIKPLQGARHDWAFEAILDKFWSKGDAK